MGHGALLQGLDHKGTGLVPIFTNGKAAHFSKVIVLAPSFLQFSNKMIMHWLTYSKGVH